jgi:hypothetical protein
MRIIFFFVFLWRTNFFVSFCSAARNGSDEVYFKNGRAFARHDLLPHEMVFFELPVTYVEDGEVDELMLNPAFPFRHVLIEMLQLITGNNETAKTFATRFPPTVPKQLIPPFSPPPKGTETATDDSPWCAIIGILEDYCVDGIALAEKETKVLKGLWNTHMATCKPADINLVQKYREGIDNCCKRIEEFGGIKSYWMQNDRLERLHHAVASHSFTPLDLITRQERPFSGIWPGCSKFAQRCSDQANCIYYYQPCSQGVTAADGTSQALPMLQIYTISSVKKDEELTWSRTSTFYGIEDDRLLRCLSNKMSARCNCNLCENYAIEEKKYLAVEQSKKTPTGKKNNKKGNKKKGNKGNKGNKKTVVAPAISGIALSEKLMSLPKSAMASLIPGHALKLPSIRTGPINYVSSLEDIEKKLVPPLENPTWIELDYARMVAEMVYSPLFAHLEDALSKKNWHKVTYVCELIRKFFSVGPGMIERLIEARGRVRILCEHFFTADRFVSHDNAWWWAALNFRLMITHCRDMHYKLSSCYCGIAVELVRLRNYPDDTVSADRLVCYYTILSSLLQHYFGVRAGTIMTHNELERTCYARIADGSIMLASRQSLSGYLQAELRRYRQRHQMEVICSTCGSAVGCMGRNHDFKQLWCFNCAPAADAHYQFDLVNPDMIEKAFKILPQFYPTTMEIYVTHIQAAVRMFVTRRHYRRGLVKIAEARARDTVSRYVQTHKSVEYFNGLRHAARVVQTRIRAVMAMRRVRSIYAAKQRLALVVQSYVRGRAAKRLSFNLELKEHMAAADRMFNLYVYRVKSIKTAAVGLTVKLPDLRAPIRRLIRTAEMVSVIIPVQQRLREIMEARRVREDYVKRLAARELIRSSVKAWLARMQLKEEERLKKEARLKEEARQKEEERLKEEERQKEEARLKEEAFMFIPVQIESDDEATPTTECPSSPLSVEMSPGGGASEEDLPVPVDEPATVEPKVATVDANFERHRQRHFANLIERNQLLCEQEARCIARLQQIQQERFYVHCELYGPPPGIVMVAPPQIYQQPPN